jgi:hypothetical protein
VATTEREPKLLASPQLAFAFCYLAAHYGLDLVDEGTVDATMDFIVRNERRLAKLTGVRAVRSR